MSIKKSRCFNSSDEKKALLKWRIEQAQESSAKCYVGVDGGQLFPAEALSAAGQCHG